MRKRDAALEKLVRERLRTRRILVGMSQEELGKRIGVSLQQISKLEIGTNRWMVSGLVLACKALKLNIADVVGPGIEPFQHDRSGSREALEMAKVYSQLRPQYQDAIRDVARKLV